LPRDGGALLEWSATMILRTAAAIALVLFTPLAAEAQHAGKVYRIGILGEKGSDPAEARLWQAFRLGLREHGWIEGENILIESRWAEGNAARYPELAADLVRLNVDLIVTRGSTHVQGAKKATSSLPIVFLVHADPVGTGHIASLARPGGNITGLALLQTELNAKGLEILTAAVSGAKRIAVLWSPDTPSHTPALKALEEAAHTLRVQLQPVGRGPGQSWRTRFRPWPEHMHRPFWCSPTQGSSPRDSAWPSWPLGTGCQPCSR
jgi:putative ABC transport system substrate-binding protein